jgi:flavin-binding protein dodecin
MAKGGEPDGREHLQVIELVGTSSESWEKAAAAVVSRTSKTLHDLRRRQ